MKLSNLLLAASATVFASALGAPVAEPQEANVASTPDKTKALPQPVTKALPPPVTKALPPPVVPVAPPAKKPEPTKKTAHKKGGDKTNIVIVDRDDDHKRGRSWSRDNFFGGRDGDFLNEASVASKGSGYNNKKGHGDKTNIVIVDRDDDKHRRRSWDRNDGFFGGRGGDFLNEASVASKGSGYNNNKKGHGDKTNIVIVDRDDDKHRRRSWDRHDGFFGGRGGDFLNDASVASAPQEASVASSKKGHGDKTNIVIVDRDDDKHRRRSWDRHDGFFGGRGGDFLNDASVASAPQEASVASSKKGHGDKTNIVIVDRDDDKHRRRSWDRHDGFFGGRGGGDFLNEASVASAPQEASVASKKGHGDKTNIVIIDRDDDKHRRRSWDRNDGFFGGRGGDFLNDASVASAPQEASVASKKGHGDKTNIVIIDRDDDKHRRRSWDRNDGFFGGRGGDFLNDASVASAPQEASIASKKGRGDKTNIVIIDRDDDKHRRRSWDRNDGFFGLRGDRF
ncbi:hypothetical protein HDV05_002308 [Chytridiales sp. JEL 0842]|nr:hypothetical protein HDV05_002308 [Chytridiales sp. JEL 0842]